MGLSRNIRWLAAAGALALALAACGGDGGETEGGEGEGGQGGEFSVYVAEPERLVPATTNETEGSEVLHALFTSLVTYDPETKEPVFDDTVIGESVESTDQQTWTIKIKDGWTFHNGEPVTAQSYVDTWNFAAHGPNAMENGYFFERVEGYDEVSPENATVKEMSGLRAVDDTTIEVKLSAPFSQFPLMLGYTAFYPMPKAAFDDIEAYEEAPIGMGPYMMDGKWVHDQHIRVKRYEDYAGPRPNADRIEFRVYAELETAFNDLLAGNLDVMDDIPPEQLATVEQQLGDRFITKPSGQFTYIGFTLYNEQFKDLKLRQAFSMAIDRQAIIDAIFSGGREPATGLVSAIVPGQREDVCGENCSYDPERAKQLLAEAGGWSGPLKMWMNSGQGHEQWMEAVANQLRENLGIQDIQFESLQFSQYLPRLQENQVDGVFRLGWVPDYPSMENYLAPVYGSSGSSNHSDYKSPEFDELMAQGDAAASIEESIPFYQQAEELVLRDLPVIPMWFENLEAGHSENISNVDVDDFDHIQVAEIQVAN